MEEKILWKGNAGAVLMGLSEAFGAKNHELHISKLCAYGFCTNEPVLNYLYLIEIRGWKAVIILAPGLNLRHSTRYSISSVYCYRKFL